MDLAKYADNQTRYVIAHPGIVIATVIVFTFLASERLTELRDKQHLRAVDVFFMAAFIFLPIFWSYFIVRAIRKLRTGSPHFYTH